MVLAALKSPITIILSALVLCLTPDMASLKNRGFFRNPFEVVHRDEMRKFHDNNLSNFIASRPEKSGHTYGEAEIREIEYSRLVSYEFFGPASAWIVPNSTHNLLFTLDAGARWRPTSGNTANGFGQISFINRLSGWTIGSNGQVWKTNDGGRYWMTIGKLDIQDVTFRAKQVKFFDNLHGWAIESPHYFWRTEDGGQKWLRYAPLGEGINADIIRLYFTSPSTGWLGCSKGTMLKTSDGGKSWESVKTGEDGPFYDLWFANEKIGRALIGNSIYSTLDGGKSWQTKFRNEEAFESPIILSLFFLTEKIGWVTGHSNMWAGKVKVPSKIKGVIYQTIDGGETWNEAKVNFQDDVFSKVFFSDPKHGWLISTNYVYRTNDGGLTWKPSIKIP